MVMTTATAAVFPWRDEYSVRIPEIDSQHKVLIRLINDLHAAMLQGKGKDALSAIVNELVRYTESHFAFEESLLQKRNYSGLAAHRQVHRDLTRQVYELREKVQAGKLTITMEVMTFLKDWLANHILSQDQAYAREIS